MAVLEDRGNAQRLRWVAILLATTALGSVIVTPASAASFNVATEAELRSALSSAGANDVINFTANIVVTTPGGGDIPAIVNNLTINGNGFSLNGSGANRGFLVYSGTVAINDLTITNTVAKGGDGGGGSYPLGGGGMGAGGGLFVAAAANVTISNVAFANTAAQGGSGGSSVNLVGLSAAGGGGGLGGNGGGGNDPSNNGGGGGVLNNQPGGNAVGGSDGTGGAGIGPGTGGGAGAGSGAGSFGGGGGGSATDVGGAGGYGGGGGGGRTVGGAGGFGGGGGSAWQAIGGAGGFGGGNGSLISNQASSGGGGAGFGGAVFVQEGGSLTVAGTLAQSGASVTGGSGFTAAAAAGSGIFLAGSGTLNFNPGAGFSQTIAGAITDQVGFVTTTGYAPPAGTYSGSERWGITKDGAGTLILSGANAYSGATQINAGTVSVGSSTALGSGPVYFYGGAIDLQNGVTLSNNISIGSNLWLNVGSGATATYAGHIDNSLGDPSFLIRTGAGTLIVTSTNAPDLGAILQGGITRLMIGNALGNAEITLDGGTLQAGASWTLNNRGIFMNAAGGAIDTNGFDITFAGPIQDSGGPGPLVKAGLGTLILTNPTPGESTYSGSTTIAAGSIQAGALNVLSRNSAFTVAAGATLDLASFNQTIGSLAGAGDVLLGTATLNTGRDNRTTVYSGVLSGTGGALVKAGTGMLTVSGNNTYTGGTTITAGTLQIGNGGASGSIIGNVVNNGMLAFNRSDNVTFSGIITGSGGLQQNGTGTTILTAANSYSGVTTINAGTLQIGNGGTADSLGTGNVVNNGTLVFNRSNSFNYGGTISGTGAFEQRGTGTTVLTGTNSYAGSTTISAGVLQIGNGGTTGSLGTGNIVNNTLLVINRSNTVVLANAISGTGSLRQDGPGTILLTGANTYTGDTIVNAGTLSVNGSIASSLTVNAGSTLAGTGTVGNTTINGGTLSPGNSIGTLTVNGNLALTGASAYLVEVSDTASDRTNVTGTAALSGANVVASFALRNYISRQYTIVNAIGGVSSPFNGLVSTNLPAGFTTALNYDANNAYLRVTMTLPSLNGLNVNQTNVVNALVNSFNTAGGIPLVFGTLTPQGLSQIAGQAATGTQQATFNVMSQFLGAMLDPFAAGRDGGAGPSGVSSFAVEDANAYAATQKGRTPGEREAYAAMARKAPPRLAVYEPRWNVWAAGYGGTQTTQGNAIVGAVDTTARIYGMAAGADYRFSPDTFVGFALGGAGTNYGLASGLGKGSSDVFQAGVYGRHQIGAAYLAAALAYGWQDVTTDRTVFGVDRLRARFDANALSGRLEGGYRFATPWIGVTPYAAGQFTTFFLPGYAEQALAGGDTFALSYASKDATASRSELGLRTDKSIALNDALLTLRGRAAWAHNFDTTRSISASFQMLPASVFVVNGAAQARDAALVSAGAELKWRNGFSLAGTFEGEFSRNVESYAGKAVVRYAW